MSAVLSWCVLLVLSVGIQHGLGSSQTVTCDVPSVPAGSDTRLTCHFPLDITKNGKNVTVRFTPDEPGSGEKEVMECRQGIGYICGKNKTAKVTMEGSNTDMAIQLENVEKNGTYRCIFPTLETENFQFQPCSFHTSPTPDGTDTTTSKSTTSLETAGDSGGSQGLAIGLPIGLIFGIVIVLVLFCRFVKCIQEVTVVGEPNADRKTVYWYFREVWRKRNNSDAGTEEERAALQNTTPRYNLLCCGQEFPLPSKKRPESGNRLEPENRNRPGPEPGNRPGSENENRSGPEPGNRSGPEPGNRSGPEPGNRSGPEPGNRSGPEPGNRPGPENGNRPGSKNGNRPGSVNGNRPGSVNGNRPGSVNGNRPGSENGNRPGNRPGPAHVNGPAGDHSVNNGREQHEDDVDGSANILNQNAEGEDCPDGPETGRPTDSRNDGTRGNTPRSTGETGSRGTDNGGNGTDDPDSALPFTPPPKEVDNTDGKAPAEKARGSARLKGRPIDLPGQFQEATPVKRQKSTPYPTEAQDTYFSNAPHRPMPPPGKDIDVSSSASACGYDQLSETAEWVKSQMMSIIDMPFPQDETEADTLAKSFLEMDITLREQVFKPYEIARQQDNYNDDCGYLLEGLGVMLTARASGLKSIHELFVHIRLVEAKKAAALLNKIDNQFPDSQKDEKVPVEVKFILDEGLPKTSNLSGREAIKRVVYEYKNYCRERDKQAWRGASSPKELQKNCDDYIATLSEIKDLFGQIGHRVKTTKHTLEQIFTESTVPQKSCKKLTDENNTDQQRSVDGPDVNLEEGEMESTPDGSEDEKESGATNERDTQVPGVGDTAAGIVSPGLLNKLNVTNDELTQPQGGQQSATATQPLLDSQDNATNCAADSGLEGNKKKTESLPHAQGPKKEPEASARSRVEEESIQQETAQAGAKNDTRTVSFIILKALGMEPDKTDELVGKLKSEVENNKGLYKHHPDLLEDLPQVVKETVVSPDMLESLCAVVCNCFQVCISLNTLQVDLEKSVERDTLSEDERKDCPPKPPTKSLKQPTREGCVFEKTITLSVLKDAGRFQFLDVLEK